MKLYGVQVAPNPTKVSLYIAEKRAGGADIAVTEVPVKLMKGEQNGPEHRARTPFASVPVLELGADDYIIESLAIMEYLEDLFPEPPMRGLGARETAQHREWERIADLRVLSPLARAIHATNSPIGLPPSADIAAQGNKTAATGLGYFNDLFSDGRAFVAGDRVSMSDCTLAAALQFARFAQAPIDPGYAHLLRWDRAYRDRPAAREVLVC